MMPSSNSQAKEARNDQIPAGLSPGGLEATKVQDPGSNQNFVL